MGSVDSETKAEIEADMAKIDEESKKAETKASEEEVEEDLSGKVACDCTGGPTPATPEHGTGLLDANTQCPKCHGTGLVDPE